MPGLALCVHLQGQPFRWICRSLAVPSMGTGLKKCEKVLMPGIASCSISSSMDGRLLLVTTVTVRCPTPRHRLDRPPPSPEEPSCQFTQARKLRLAKTRNLLMTLGARNPDIVPLRELHAELNRAILACYGWSALGLGHGFHQNERGQTRCTISPGARREILRLLFRLNRRIVEEERSQET